MLSLPTGGQVLHVGYGRTGWGSVDLVVGDGGDGADHDSAARADAHLLNGST
jgi:hypothetical protein